MKNKTLEVIEINSKSALVNSKLPDADYVINPYTGCSFGCIYCYASFMGRFVDKKIDDWGNYVFVKTNIDQLLKNDLNKLKNTGKGKTIFLSSVTDPYQGIEAKYQLTRRILQTIAESGCQSHIGILTKSDLVLRDIDIIKKIKNIEVGFTITSTNDSISRYFEKYAPNISQRLKALKTLNREGINTYAFVGPVLPHYIANENKLDEVFKAIKDTGTKEVYVEHINLSTYIKDRLINEMADSQKEVLDKFYLSSSKDYRQDLDKIVHKLIAKNNLKLKLNQTIYHHEK